MRQEEEQTGGEGGGNSRWDKGEGEQDASAKGKHDLGRGQDVWRGGKRIRKRQGLRQEEEQTGGEGGGKSRWEKGRGRRIPPGKLNRFSCGVLPSG